MSSVTPSCMASDVCHVQNHGRYRRVLIFSSVYGIGGPETHLGNLCQLLVDKGSNVTWATRMADPNTPFVKHCEDMGVKAVGTPLSSTPGWERLSGLAARVLWPLWLGRRRFDVLYVIEATGLARTLARSVKPGGFVIWNQFGPWAYTAPKKSRRLVNRGVFHGVIVETAKQAEAFRQNYEVSLPVAVIPHLAQASVAPRRTVSCAQDGILRVAFLGRMVPDKQLFRLLDIWAQLNIGSSRLRFHGQGSDELKLREEIRRRGMGSEVEVVGPYDVTRDLVDIMADTDLVVLLGRAEGLPLTLIEAMSYGVPFVACDVASVADLAADNPDVRVVPMDNRAIAQAIEEMAHAIRAGHIRGERLQAYYRQRYSPEVLAPRWEQALLRPEEVFPR